MTPPEAAPRICERCRLVIVEALPPVKGWSGVCPRCGLAADLDDTARPVPPERPA